jgi:hypothetical protein
MLSARIERAVLPVHRNNTFQGLAWSAEHDVMVEPGIGSTLSMRSIKRMKCNISTTIGYACTEVTGSSLKPKTQSWRRSQPGGLRLPSAPHAPDTSPSTTRRCSRFLGMLIRTFLRLLSFARSVSDGRPGWTTC